MAAPEGETKLSGDGLQPGRPDLLCAKVAGSDALVARCRLTANRRAASLTGTHLLGHKASPSYRRALVAGSRPSRPDASSASHVVASVSTNTSPLC